MAGSSLRCARSPVMPKRTRMQGSGVRRIRKPTRKGVFYMGVLSMDTILSLGSLHVGLSAAWTAFYAFAEISWSVK